MRSFYINLKTFVNMFKQLMAIMEKKHRVEAVVVLVGAFLCAILETLGVGAILPFILALLSPDELMSNQYVSMFANYFNITNYKRLLVFIAVGIILVYVIKNSTVVFFQYFQGKIHNEIERDLNIKMYKAFMFRPYSFYLQVNTADVIRGISSDISSVAQVIDKFSGLISELITCIMIGVFIIAIDPFFAIGLIISAAFLALFFILIFKKKTAEIGATCRELFSEKSKLVMQSVAGYKEISLLQKKEYFIGEYQEIATTACKKNTGYLIIQKLPSRVIETVFISALLCFVMIEVLFFGENTHFVAMIGTMAVAAVRILPSISNIASSVNGLVYYRVALESAYDNIMQARGACINNRTMDREDCIDEGIVFDKELSLKDVVFRYDNTEKDVISGITLTINKNESVAFVGESGAGKSTLIDLLLGLLIPQDGKVLMDSYEIKDIPYEWANIVGYVPQTVYLLDDSVRRNIAFGINEEDVNDEIVWECLRKAKLDEFIMSLPEKLDTKVGERGVRFSGGQRQRIAIARALYHSPSILVLDEATSALDNETEREVMSAIDSLHGKMTIIIVAHRLSTIENCDKVYEIVGGKAVAKKYE